MLGQVGREQAGILETQRKQAAYGILASFFDSLRRYRKEQGRLLLKLLRFLPTDTLVRIAGDTGVAQYAPLVRLDDTARYDVIVGEAAAGPNQKDRTFQFMLQLMPILKDANLPADVWAEFARYSPLPNAIAEKIARALAAHEAQGPDPLERAAQEAAVAKTQAEARQANAEAMAAEAQARAQIQAMGPAQTFPLHDEAIGQA